MGLTLAQKQQLDVLLTTGWDSTSLMRIWLPSLVVRERTPSSIKW
jgi:hypothetical protein